MWSKLELFFISNVTEYKYMTDDRFNTFTTTMISSSSGFYANNGQITPSLVKCIPVSKITKDSYSVYSRNLKIDEKYKSSSMIQLY